MDMQISVLDGFKATQTLRKKSFSKPIIALTTYAMRDEQSTCRKAACNEYPSKPIDYNRLIETVARLGKLEHNQKLENFEQEKTGNLCRPT